jgi:hypothetical protein
MMKRSKMKLDKYDKDFIKALLVISISVVVIIGLLTMFCLAVPSSIFNYNYCETHQTLMPHINFKWVFWGGCLLEAPDGTWVSAPDYLSVDRLRLQLEGDIK